MSDVARDIDEIRNYLQGRLSEEQELVFQDRLARDPMLARELEQSLRMREGLQQLEAEGYFATAATTRDSRTRGIPQWLVPLAAAAVIATVCVYVWMDRASVLTALPAARAGGASAIVTQFTFISMRDAPPKISAPASGLIELRAAPETVIASSYRLTLIRHQGALQQHIGSLGGLSPAGDGYLHAYAEAARLEPGSYVLQVAPESASSSEPNEYPFTLQSPAASPAR